MKPDELKSLLAGVLGFSPTPFTPDGEIDRDGLASHIDRLSESRVGAIVVCGGVGEFYALETEEHATVVATAVDAADGRVPVIAGIGHSTRIAQKLAEQSAACGVAGFLINPPYFVEPTGEGVRKHYEALGETGLGSIVYHCRQGFYDLDTLRALADVDTVVAVKDEIGDLEGFVAARAALGDRFSWINGMAELFATSYFAAGATAMTSGLVNFAPALTFAVWDAAVDRRDDVAGGLIENYVLPLARLRERRPGYGITVVKEAMQMIGIGAANVRLPLVPLDEGERAELADILAQLQKLGYVEAPPEIHRTVGS